MTKFLNKIVELFFKKKDNVDEMSTKDIINEIDALKYEISCFQDVINKQSKLIYAISNLQYELAAQINSIKFFENQDSVSKEQGEIEFLLSYYEDDDIIN